jgi:hypothetical protein
VQEAYASYTRHATRCVDCRDIDGTCDIGTELHRAWRDLATAALDRLAGKASPRRQ